MQKQIQKTILGILEKELITILALLLTATWIFLVKAQSDIQVSVSVYPVGGAITVVSPNGGESWTIGTTATITWTTQGPITDVKIELQRSTGGSWETLISSTTNDGSYSWPVTSPATSQALIKISKVDDDTVNDTSNAVFTINSSRADSGGGGGGGGYNPPVSYAAIDTVVPRVFSNVVAVNMKITGVYFEGVVNIWLGNHLLQPNYVWPEEISVTVPAKFPVGEYTLCLLNSIGEQSCYFLPIVVYEDQYQARIVDRSGADLTLLPNERVEAWIVLSNNSTYIWDKTGINKFRLGVVNDQPSIFYDSTTWATTNRAAQLEENAVGYGETGTFRFYLKAPYKIGEYEESFAPVIEGITWLTAPEIKWHITVVPAIEEPLLPPTTGGIEIYSAMWIRQSPYPTLNPGETATLWVDFRNTSNMPWLNDRDYPVRLGTARPLDRTSDFRNGDWILDNRPAQVQNSSGVSLSGSGANGVIQPGEIGRFTFTIETNSNKAGKYREYFRPVVEYKTWLEDWGVYWDITIKSTPAQIESPTTGGVTQPQEPETKILVPYQPTTAPQFSLPNFINNTFNNLVNSLNNALQSIRLFFKF
ncbi:MAG: hypothetical protein V1719_00930 [Patescibacteria group bacterium]